MHQASRARLNNYAHVTSGAILELPVRLAPCKNNFLLLREVILTKENNMTDKKDYADAFTTAEKIEYYQRKKIPKLYKQLQEAQARLWKLF